MVIITGSSTTNSLAEALENPFSFLGHRSWANFRLKYGDGSSCPRWEPIFLGGWTSINPQLFDWLVVWNMNGLFSIIYGMSSFPLTDSYFSRWLKPPTSWCCLEVHSELFVDLFHIGILGIHRGEVITEHIGVNIPWLYHWGMRVTWWKDGDGSTPILIIIINYYCFCFYYYCYYYYYWLVVWNMFFFHILGMSSSQLTFIFVQRGRYTTNQIIITIVGSINIHKPAI